ncbi:MAG: SYNERG-CTERM sorting domain-containing protein [Synergistaceae bacterium]|nr:SYNERG-CTERM sorting domain-containing protein [Synergistaceae bacterium]
MDTVTGKDSDGDVLYGDVDSNGLVTWKDDEADGLKEVSYTYDSGVTGADEMDVSLTLSGEAEDNNVGGSGGGCSAGFGALALAAVAAFLLKKSR